MEVLVELPVKHSLALPWSDVAFCLCVWQQGPVWKRECPYWPKPSFCLDAVRDCTQAAPRRARPQRHSSGLLTMRNGLVPALVGPGNLPAT
jgi:hypothetical protein